MAACPVLVDPPSSTKRRRRPLVVTPRRLAANRRNAARSTGPRTTEGKAKVARNPIKHGFFVAQQKWSPSQHRDFEEVRLGLVEEFQPQGSREEECVATIASSYVRMAAMLRWENVAALKYHQQCERKMNERIAVADEAEAMRLLAHRETLRAAGLWCPILPGPRDLPAIIRYSGRLDRAIRAATAELEGLKRLRGQGASRPSKAQKQTHLAASPRSGPPAAEGPRWPRKWKVLLAALEEQSHSSAESLDEKSQEQTHYDADASGENEKAKPLSSTFTGNRHQRRRAKALARRSR